MTPLEQVVASSQRLGLRTRNLYLRRVHAYVEFAGANPYSWTMASLEAWRDHLLHVQRLSPKTINVYMAAVYFASRRHHERGGGEHFARGAERIRVAVNATQPDDKALTVAQCRRLIAGCSGDDPVALRDRTMILLGLHAAFRRAELCSITFDNTKRHMITVVAKGERIHTVPIDEEAWEPLQAWMTWLRARHVRDGFVFRSLRPAIEPNRWHIGDGLTGDGFSKLLKIRGEACGIEGLHPHALRHTYATLATEAGVPWWKVKKVLGHSTGDVTMQYVSTYDEPSGATLPRFT